MSQIRRFAGGGSAVIAPGASDAMQFQGPVATVTVGATDVVTASGTVHVQASTPGDDLHFALCYRLTGAVTQPSVLGGPDATMLDIDMALNDNAFGTSSAGALAPATYDVGMCAAAFMINTTPTYFSSSSGWVQVARGTGSLGRTVASGVRSHS